MIKLQEVLGLSEEPIGTRPAPRGISASIRRRRAHSARLLARPHPLATLTPEYSRPPPAFTPLGLLFTRPSPPALFCPPVVAPRPNGFLSCLVAPPKGKEPQSTRKTLQVDGVPSVTFCPLMTEVLFGAKKKTTTKNKKQHRTQGENLISLPD